MSILTLQQYRVIRPTPQLSGDIWVLGETPHSIHVEGEFGPYRVSRQVFEQAIREGRMVKVDGD